MIYTKERPNVKLNCFKAYIDNGFKLLRLDKRPLDKGEPNPHRGKRPVQKEWLHRKGASSDTARQYMSRGYNIGAAIPAGVLVLDIDPRNEGGASIERLLDEAGLPCLEDMLAGTFSVKTGGGGWHLFYRFTSSFAPVGKIKGFEGIDVLTHGRQVVTPGSWHYEKKDFYQWTGHTEHIADLPADLKPYIFGSRLSSQSKTSRASKGRFGLITSDELRELLGALDPKDYRDYNGRWFPLLATAHHATGGDAAACRVFGDWSALDPEYGDEGRQAAEKKWDTAHEEGNSGGEARTVNTILMDVKGSCLTALMELRKPEDLIGPWTSLERAEELINEIGAREAVQEFSVIDLDEETEEDEEDDTKKIIDRLERLPTGYEKSSPRSHEKIIKLTALKVDRTNWSTIARQLADKRSDKLSPAKIEREIKRVKAEIDKKTAPTKLTLTHVQIQKAVMSRAIERHSGGDPENLNSPPNGAVYKYQGGVWVQDSWRNIEKTCHDIASELVDDTNKAAKFLSDYARKARESLSLVIATEDEALYNSSTLPSSINLLNKTLDIDPQTGKKTVRDHRREDFLTSQLPYDYDEEATCPGFDTMLEQVFNHVRLTHGGEEKDKLITHFWELVGYMIQPRKDLPRILIWTGSGQNGKSRIAKIITRLVGDANWIAEDVEHCFSDSNPHAIPSLEGKLIFLDDDVKADTLLNDGVLKKVSENKSLQANPKHRDQYKARLFITPLLITNNRLRLNDTSYGITRRLDVIHWGTDITHLQGSPLPDKVEQEQMPGVLNKAIDGLCRLRKRGYFDPPKCTEKYKSDLLIASNSIYAFWCSLKKDRVEGREESMRDLYDRYQCYMTDIGAYRSRPNLFVFSDAIVKLSGNSNGSSQETIVGWKFS